MSELFKWILFGIGAALAGLVLPPFSAPFAAVFPMAMPSIWE